tara:strand:+ start:905 stop:1219 length:315 start_codon:yes stop_codon:yes gene_type:complete
MANEGLNTLTQRLARNPNGTYKCEAGCMVFDGGERKHHRDCVHYPESLTKLWHDTEIEYLDKIDALESELSDAVETAHRRGAVEWTKSNYPKIYAMLNEGQADG